jgi:Sema domain
MQTHGCDFFPLHIFFLFIIRVLRRRLVNINFSTIACCFSTLKVGNINKVLETVSGIAKCPYSPHANSTALMTASGRFFAATTTDFSSADPVISRSLGDINTLRTSQYNSMWLSEPDFVGAFETQEFVYFLFRESAVEYINCGKVNTKYLLFKSDLCLNTVSRH